MVGLHFKQPMREYLSLPALSQGPARATLDRCPKAGWFESHLNDNRPDDTTKGAELGTLSHSILLEGDESGIVIVDPEDHPTDKGTTPVGWTSKGMKQARDDARALGKIPVLPEDMRETRLAVASARAFIESLRTTEPHIWRMFQDGTGHSEVTGVWKEGETLCRLRADRISDDMTVICDYKGASSAEPSLFARTQVHGGGNYAFGAAWYQRGIEALTGKVPAYVWLVQEFEAPYLCSLVSLDPSGLALAQERVAAAIGKWNACAAVGEWPGYANRTYYPETPEYMKARWLEQQIGPEGYPYDYATLTGRPAPEDMR